MAASIVRRPSRFAGDYDGLIALMTAVADADGGGIKVVPDDVRLEFVDDEPGWVRAHTVWESAGDLVAYAAVWHEPGDPDDRAYASLDIHPAHRTPALEDEVAHTLLATTRELTGKPVTLRLGARRSQAWKTAMLDRAGLTADRHFHRMRRSLAEPNDPPMVPDGYTLRPMDPDTEVAAWCAAFEEANAASYDPPRLSEADRRNLMARAGYLPQGDLVAVTDSGELAGYTWAQRQIAADGSTHGWIDQIGVLPPHRSRGLARALLLTSLDILRDDGQTEAALAVDTDNAHGAGRLYESTGFVAESTTVVYLAHLG